MANLFTVTNSSALTVRATSSEPPSETDEQFLRLLLMPDTTVILPVRHLSEVLTIPMNQIVPIPHLPGWVMGIYNWRGEILWMVDLGHLFGLTPWYEYPSNRVNFSAIVLNLGDRALPTSTRNEMVGLVVHEVDDIEWCNSEEIRQLAASFVIPGMAPFLRGYWWKPDGEMLAVLNPEAIFNAMPKSDR